MRLWLLTLFLSGLLSLGQAGTLTENRFQAGAYEGSQDRTYQVYVPEGLSGTASLVMVLHGCSQTSQDVLRDWGMQAAADRYGFILVTPFITRWDGLRGSNCWGFWLPQHRQRGSGESEDLYQIAREVEQRFPIDPQRRYVTGLSSGGAMAAILAVTHNEYWAAVATVAGLPYGEDAMAVSILGVCPGWSQFHPLPRTVATMRAQLGANPYPMPLLVVQNERDCSVKQAAGLLLRDAQLALYGAPGRQTAAATAQGEATPCQPVYAQDYGCRHARHSRDGRPDSPSLVETVWYEGPLATPYRWDQDLGHYWIGGEHGQEGPYTRREGPSHPDIIWDFFRRHPREGAAGGSPAIASAHPETSAALTRAPCTSKTASPFRHLVAGRARLTYWGLMAISSGDQAQLGLSWNWWSRLTLHEGPGGDWFFARPAGCAPESGE